MLRLYSLLILFVLSCLPTFALQRVSGYCSQGGIQGQVQFTTSVVTPKFLGSYPGCTVSAYQTGTTTLLTIYSDSTGTPKGNPFSADAATGYWFYYISGSGQTVDNNFSGAGISTPFTVPQQLGFDIQAGITQLTGDVLAGPGTGSQPATLATINTSPGTCPVDLMHTCQFTTDGKGRVLSQSQSSIIPGSGLQFIGSNLSTIYNGLNALYYCTTPLSPDDTCITNAYAAGISNKVIVSGGMSWNGTVDVPTNNNLELRAGTYTLGNNAKLILEPGSSLTCPDGPYATIISVPQTYAVTDQVITLNGSVTAMQTLRGCQIKFYVPPGATNRAGVIQYAAWAIGGPQPASFLVDDFVISGAWNAINLNTGANNGKITIRDTIVSSFNRMIDMDYLVDTVTLSNVKGWPIGLLNTQYPAFFDPLNIGIRSGRVDDLKVSDSSFDNGQCASFYAGTGGQTVGTFNNTSCDTNSGVTMSSGDITWTGGYFSIGNAAARALNMTGGIFIDNGVKWGIVSTSTDFQIQVSGPSQFYKNGGYINTGSNDVTAIGLSGTQAYVSVVGAQFLRSPNIAYVNPTITNTGSARLMLANNFLTDKGTGTAYFVTQTTDGFSTFVNNALLGWSMNLPGTFTSILYQNNSGLGPSSFGVQSYSVYPFTCPGGQHAASMSSTGVMTCN